MIFDLFSNHSCYALCPKIAKGFAWIDQASPSLPDGRYGIEGDEVYALVQSYETALAETKKFESHRRYLDIQFMVSGSEIIHYAPITALQAVTAYDEAKDFMLYGDGGRGIPLQFDAGCFAIFYPQDGHKPGCVNGPLNRIKKIVVKVRI